MKTYTSASVIEQHKELIKNYITLCWFLSDNFGPEGFIALQEATEALGIEVYEEESESKQSPIILI